MSDRQKEIAKEVAKNNQCNCDLDNWQPERSTGHSWVCRIHKMAGSKYREEQKSEQPQ